MKFLKTVKNLMQKLKNMISLNAYFIFFLVMNLNNIVKAN